MKRWLLIATVCALVVVMFFGAACRKKTDISKLPPVVVALGPTFAEADVKKFDALKGHLETQFGKPFQFQTFATRKEFADFVKEGKAAFVFANPIDYGEVADGCIVLAKANYPGIGSMTQGVLIVKEGEAKKIRDISTLKGTSIMIINKSSLGGYLSQKMFFSRNELDLDLDFALRESPDGKADGVINAVAAGEVEYGCVPASLYPDGKPARGTEVLTITEKVPVDVFAYVEMAGDKMLGGKMKTVLTKIPKDDPMLKAAGIESFSIATQAEYDIVTNFLAQDKITKAQREAGGSGSPTTP